MSENKDNKEEFWADENLNPVFDKDFLESTDDHNSWIMVNEIKLKSIIEKNSEVDQESIEKIQTYLMSINDHNRLSLLSKILDKNSKKEKIIKSLDNGNCETILKQRVYKFYIEEYNLEFAKNHVDSDVKVYLDNKSREDKLEKLLG